MPVRPTPPPVPPAPASPAKRAMPWSCVDPLVDGLAFYYLTTLVVVIGVWLGESLLQPARQGSKPDHTPFANWDGEWYLRIVREGYTYDPDRQSSVAFFPAYPLAAWLLARLTGLGAEMALLVVAHSALAASFVLLAAYTRQRFSPAAVAWLSRAEPVEPSAAPVAWLSRAERRRLAPAPTDLPQYVLLALGLMPVGFFFRMAYSESLFLLTAILTLYGIERRWPASAVAIVAGLASAVRPVGIALAVPLALYLWRQSASTLPTAHPPHSTLHAVRSFALRCVYVLPLAGWGLAAYMAYLYWRFGDPLAFMVAHSHWHFRPLVPLGEKLVSLATLEPIWSVYDIRSPAYWASSRPNQLPAFNLMFANPIFFVAAAVLVAIGAGKGWISSYEWLLAGLLIAIPYVTRSYEMCMGSMGRFTAVVFPIYLVLGRVLCGAGPPLSGALLGLSAFLLGVYAAMFAAWYLYI